MKITIDHDTASMAGLSLIAAFMRPSYIRLGMSGTVWLKSRRMALKIFP
jgi:hypothetical protein